MAFDPPGDRPNLDDPGLVVFRMSQRAEEDGHRGGCFTTGRLFTTAGFDAQLHNMRIVGFAWAGSSIFGSSLAKLTPTIAPAVVTSVPPSFYKPASTFWARATAAACSFAGLVINDRITPTLTNVVPRMASRLWVDALKYAESPTPATSTPP
jgi:hypothetical protein